MNNFRSSSNFYFILITTFWLNNQIMINIGILLYPSFMQNLLEHNSWFMIDGFMNKILMKVLGSWIVRRRGGRPGRISEKVGWNFQSVYTILVNLYRTQFLYRHGLWLNSTRTELYEYCRCFYITTFLIHCYSGPWI